MDKGSPNRPTRRWFDVLLRRLPVTVRYRLFGPAYEDLRHDHLLRFARVRWPGVRPVLVTVFTLRVLALVAACYRDSPEFVLVHPVRAIGAGLRGVVACAARWSPSRSRWR